MAVAAAAVVGGVEQAVVAVAGVVLQVAASMAMPPLVRLIATGVLTLPSYAQEWSSEARYDLVFRDLLAHQLKPQCCLSDSSSLLRAAAGTSALSLFCHFHRFLDRHHEVGDVLFFLQTIGVGVGFSLARIIVLSDSLA